jgi:hypothetical protein
VSPMAVKTVRDAPLRNERRYMETKVYLTSPSPSRLAGTNSEPALFTIGDLSGQSLPVIRTV